MRRLLVAAVSVLLLSSSCSLGGGGKQQSAVEQADYVFAVARPFLKKNGEEPEPRGLAGASAVGDRQTRVVISLDDPEARVLNAEIRSGDCLGSLGNPVYPLEDVVDGESESVVDVQLEELLERGYVVFIGDWDSEGQLCGDFFGAEEN